MNYSQDWQLENSYTDLPEQFFTKINPVPVSAPKLLIFNNELAKSLGIDLDFDDKEMLANLFSGNTLPKNTNPIAQAYAGHQFGHFSMLGDGRAHLIGEKISIDGKRYDIQFKGSGQTPYSRGGDGRAAIGPMLREYLISEAMHALKIPTTRSLAVVSTGESIMRSSLLDGAILTRVASSHIRIGTFEYANRMLGYDQLKKLADYAIERHYPEILDHENIYLDFLNAVIERQAKLVASWMHIGFIHGVMNTDNMSISGETIDYGPCAFMDIFSMDRVFSSIDYQGRYKFGSQAHAAHWNLGRLADSLLPLLHKDMDEAIKLAEASLSGYSKIFNDAWITGMRHKLGIDNEEVEDLSLAQNLLEWMQNEKIDYTKTFYDLSQKSLPDNEIYNSKDFQKWHSLWQVRLAKNSTSINSSLKMMQANNPVIIPNNYYVEEALKASEEGDLKAFLTLLEVLKKPFEATKLNEPYRSTTINPIPNYQTFCGT
tara:strand:+ start:18593 stop:20050 length:1458 start_codon:yes stop_codon:yes gene_type:complete